MMQISKKIELFITIIIIFFPIVLYSQQDSRYDSGLNLPFNQKAGNVNPQTGNVSVSVADVSLPGRAGFHAHAGYAG